VKPGTRAVLELLRRHPEGVTALTALDEVGSFRLGARIYELKAEGYDVETTWTETYNGKRIAKYRLHETEQLVVGL
jgi:helix-turn-helix protein